MLRHLLKNNKRWPTPLLNRIESQFSLIDGTPLTKKKLNNKNESKKLHSFIQKNERAFTTTLDLKHAQIDSVTEKQLWLIALIFRHTTLPLWVFPVQLCCHYMLHYLETFYYIWVIS